ncbi:MAG: VOC family protein [Steroidobacteraceae bacterium]
MSRVFLQVASIGMLAAWLATAAGCSTIKGSSEAAVTGSSTHAPIESQIVMFYYDDLAAPTEFYGKTLGLAQTQDFGWARFFQVVPGSEVGIVKGGPGAYYTPQARNAVMLSIVTPDVDAWYGRLKDQPGIDILKPLQSHGGAPIRNFMIRDPGGYTIEIFQWLKKP